MQVQVPVPVPVHVVQVPVQVQEVQVPVQVQSTIAQYFIILNISQKSLVSLKCTRVKVKHAQQLVLDSTWHNS